MTPAGARGVARGRASGACRPAGWSVTSGGPDGRAGPGAAASAGVRRRRRPGEAASGAAELELALEPRGAAAPAAGQRLLKAEAPAEEARAAGSRRGGGAGGALRGLVTAVLCAAFLGLVSAARAPCGASSGSPGCQCGRAGGLAAGTRERRRLRAGVTGAGKARRFCEEKGVFGDVPRVRPLVFVRGTEAGPARRAAPQTGALPRPGR